MAGQYFIEGTSTACVSCPAGSATPNGSATSAAACVACPVGTFSQAGSLCAPCLAGTYSTASGASSCVACSAGMFVNGTGNLNCSTCGPGLYSPSGASACTQCSAGTFSANSSQAANNTPAAFSWLLRNPSTGVYYVRFPQLVTGQFLGSAGAVSNFYYYYAYPIYSTLQVNMASIVLNTASRSGTCSNTGDSTYEYICSADGTNLDFASPLECNGAPSYATINTSGTPFGIQASAFYNCEGDGVVTNCIGSTFCSIRGSSHTGICGHAAHNGNMPVLNTATFNADVIQACALYKTGTGLTCTNTETVTYVPLSSCLPCAVGAYSSGPGSSSCTLCGAGNYVPSGTTSCLACPANTTSYTSVGDATGPAYSPPKAQFSASSYYDGLPLATSVYASYALNSGGMWLAANAEYVLQNSWLQFDLLTVLPVKAVVTQGANANSYVTSILVATSANGVTFTNLSSSMKANADATTVVVNTLPFMVYARYVRIYVLAFYKQAGMRAGVRLGLSGCMCQAGYYSNVQYGATGISECSACPNNSWSGPNASVCTVNAGYYFGTRFPPSAMSANSAVISGTTYTASSCQVLDAAHGAYAAFDQSLTTGYVNLNWRYQGAGNTYTTAECSTTVNGVAVGGEWLQLGATGSNVLTGYAVNSPLSGYAAVYAWVLAGSNDGTTWTQIESVTTLTSAWATAYDHFYNGNAVLPWKSFSYFRIIITQSAINNLLSIIELKLFGSTPSACSGSCAAGGSLRCAPTGTAVCCSAGQFFIDGVSTACQSCAAGTFSVNGGQTTCLQCPANTNSTPGSALCTCAVGYYHNTTTGTCVQCDSSKSFSSGATACIAFPSNSTALNPVLPPGMETEYTSDSYVYAVYAFPANGTITFPSAVKADILVVGGGGGGCDGGGGAGGVKEYPRQSLGAGTYNVTVGAGGTACRVTGFSTQPLGGNGASSSITGPNLFSLTALGGGGGEYSTGSTTYTANVASGGGAGLVLHATYPFQSWITQYAGGFEPNGYGSGGGGGAGGVGGVPTILSGQYRSGVLPLYCAVGGIGLQNNYRTGSNQYYGGGGGGGTNTNLNSCTAALTAGGLGGGGNGNTGPNLDGTAGAANTGGGGGGADWETVPTNGAGGSGIVVIRVWMATCWCLAGTYMANGTACVQCSAGTYSGLGATVCALCAAGTYGNQSGASQCTTCSSGSYCPTGSVAPVLCAAGSYCSTPSSQLPCTLGAYCPSGSTANTACAAGSVCETTVLQSPCTLSNYCPAGTTAQTPCAAGYFCSVPSAQASCTLPNYCPAGSTTQTLCAAGSYCGSTTSQLACVAGYLCPAGTTAPIACSPGAYCVAGETASVPCALGYYCSTPETQTACGTGYFCLVSSTAQTPCTATCAAAGTYESVACAATTDRVCSGCTNLVGNATYTGVGTTIANCPWVCNPGFYQNGSACKPCPANSWCSAGVQNQCPLNTISSALSPSQNSCLCQQGYFGNGSLTGTSPCAICLAGSYCAGGNANASTPCPGNFTSNAGAYLLSHCYCLPGYQSVSTACTLCPANGYCASGVLNPCPVHSASAEGSASNASCVCVGGFRGASGQCAQCEANSYCTGGLNATQCTAHALSPPQSANATACYCDRGYEGVANAPCAVCPANTWCWTGVLNQCPAHSSSPALSSYWYNCTCDPGHTGPDGGPCSPCAAGTYKGSQGGAACTTCPPANQCPQGSVAPVDCAAGYYCSLGQVTICPPGHRCAAGVSAPVPCAVGTFANATGRVDCTPCPEDSYADGIGSASCVSCPFSSFAPAFSNTSLACSCSAGLFMQDEV